MAVLTINAQSSNPSTSIVVGANSVSILNTVTVGVTVRDIEDDSLVTGARVLLQAADGTGNLPYLDSVSITSSGTTATVSHTTHLLATGNKVQISGASPSTYNGVYSITVSDADTYTYTMWTTATSPATGSPTSTGVVISDSTTAGVAQNTTFNYSVDQPVEGYVRKGTATIYYVPTDLAGTITEDGLSLIGLMVRDE